MGYGTHAVNDGSRGERNRYILPALGRRGHLFLRSLAAAIEVNTYPLAWERPGSGAGGWGAQQSPTLLVTNRIDGSLVCRVDVADFGRDLQVNLDYTNIFNQANEYLRLSVVGYIEMVDCLVTETAERLYVELGLEKKEPVIVNTGEGKLV
jgi:hypothetical protein